MPMATKEEQRAWQLVWITRRRLDWIESVGGKCASCGSADRLEVDHIDPAKKTMHPTSIWSRRAEAREAELANCQVLCYDCHKAKTRAEALAPCGTRSAYDRGCRCTECRAAKAKSAREYRASKRAA